MRQRAKLKQERCGHWEADKALRRSSRIDEVVEIPESLNQLAPVELKEHKGIRS